MLRRAGFANVQLIEKASQLSEIGAGIQIGANGARILDRLGLSTELASLAGFSPSGLLMDGRTASTICTYPLDAWAQQEFGQRHYQLHRADLQNILLRALWRENLAPVLNSRLVGVRQLGAEVEVELASGEMIAGDLLIGADGLRSSVRELLGDTQPPTFSGKICWRSVIDLDESETALAQARIWAGAGKHLVQYPLRCGRQLNLVACIEGLQAQSEQWEGNPLGEDLIEAFSGYCAEVRGLVARAAPTARSWGLFHRAGPSKWWDGRVVLLGDAAHPMLPSLAQGAVMALEDAAVLAALLTAQLGREPAEALQSYQELRQARVARVQRSAIANMRLFHRRGAMSPLKMGVLRALGPRAEPFLGNKLSWLYGFDAAGSACSSSRSK